VEQPQSHRFSPRAECYCEPDVGER